VLVNISLDIITTAATSAIITTNTQAKTNRWSGRGSNRKHPNAE